MALQGCLTLEQLLTDISRTNPGTLDPSLLTDAFNKSPFDSTPLTFSQRLSAETGPHFDKIREHQEALVAFQYLCGEKARGVAFQYLCGEKARGIMAQSGSAWEEKKVWEGIAEKMGKELKKDVPGLATNYRALTERIKTRTDVEEAIGVERVERDVHGGDCKELSRNLMLSIRSAVQGWASARDGVVKTKEAKQAEGRAKLKEAIAKANSKPSWTKAIGRERWMSRWWDWRRVRMRGRRALREDKEEAQYLPRFVLLALFLSSPSRLTFPSLLSCDHSATGSLALGSVQQHGGREDIGSRRSSSLDGPREQYIKKDKGKGRALELDDQSSPSTAFSYVTAGATA
jgi:hypothetical protein